MTLLEWIGAFVLNFCGSLVAFIVWTHLDAEGWWEQRRIERGRRLDQRNLIDNPSFQQDDEGWLN